MTTIFAWWGVCGGLNTAGEADWYFLATIIQLFLLATSGLLVAFANSRIVPNRFDKKGKILPSYLVSNSIALLLRVYVAYISLVVLLDAAFGDGNMSDSYEDGIPCDPIDTWVLIQALTVLALTLFVLKRQYKKFVYSKQQAQLKKNHLSSKRKKLH